MADFVPPWRHVVRRPLRLPTCRRGAGERRHIIVTSRNFRDVERPWQGSQCPSPFPGRTDHDPVHRSERLSRAESRADLRDVDPRSGHLDGDPATVQGCDDPGKQYRSDHRQRGRDAGGDHLRLARPGDDRLVAEFSLCPDRADHRDRGHIGRDVLRAAASRIGSRHRPALSRRRRRRRGAADRRRVA